MAVLLVAGAWGAAPLAQPSNFSLCVTLYSLNWLVIG
jgi:hypothetical protein